MTRKDGVLKVRRRKVLGKSSEGPVQNGNTGFY